MSFPPLLVFPGHGMPYMLNFRALANMKPNPMCFMIKTYILRLFLGRTALFTLGTFPIRFYTCHRIGLQGLSNYGVI
jgi:hypothetical protein